MDLTFTLESLQQATPKNTQSRIKSTYARYVLLFYFINYRFADLFDMFEKKYKEIAENNSQEILKSLDRETSTQCMFLSYNEDNASKIKNFTLKCITFLNMQFPQNKLSICVLNKKAPFGDHIDQLLYLKNIILKDKDSDQNIKNENYVLIKDMQTFNQENNKTLLEEYIRNFNYKCDVFLYEYNCVRDCNLLLSSIFKFKEFDHVAPEVVSFYIAMQSEINVFSEFNTFRNYLDKWNFEHPFSLLGRAIKLAPASGNNYNYEIVEGTMSVGSYNFIETSYNCKEYSINKQDGDENNGRKFIKQTIIDYQFVKVKTYLTLYNKMNKKTLAVQQKYKIEDDIESLIEIKFVDYIRTSTVEGIYKLFYFVVMDKLILINNFCYQKIMIIERDVSKSLRLHSFVLCPNQEHKHNILGKETLSMTRIFNNACNFIFDASLKCRKCLDIQRQILYFRSMLPWIQNESFTYFGQEFKYLIKLTFKETLNLADKLTILSKKLKVLDIKATTIKHNFFAKSESFMYFYDNFHIYETDFFSYNIKISDDLKTTIFENNEHGLRGTIEKGDSTNSFYLFIIPEMLFKIVDEERIKRVKLNCVCFKKNSDVLRKL